MATARSRHTVARVVVGIVALLVMAAVGVFVVSGGVEDGTSTTPRPEGDSNPDLRVVQLNLPRADGGTLEVVVEEGDYSVLVVVGAEDLDTEVFFDGVSGPDEFTLEPADIPQPVNNGENALLLPLAPDEPLIPGTYTIEVFTEGQLRDARAVVKSGDPDRPQVIDVDFFLVSDTGRLDAEADREDLAERYRGVAEGIFGPFDLAVDEIRFIDVPDELIAGFSELDLPSGGTDSSQRQLCQALDELADDSRTLRFAIIDAFIDVEDPEGETEGNAAGIPGAVGLFDTVTSCVAIQADGSRDLDELGTTAWHEAAHLLGLFHTTEAEGEVFDPLTDTPECRFEEFDTDGDGEVTDVECGSLGGGDNFMFHDSDGTTMTAGQAAVLRLSPLFRPT